MDWQALLNDHHIHWVDRGQNTKKGEISVKCPWCGSDDPSEHLGISLNSQNWGCHRNATHRGKSPAKLIQALLGCSFSQAKLTVEQYDAADPDSLPDVLAALLDPIPGESRQAPINLRLPRQFQAIPNSGRFFNYLSDRGFDDPVKVAEIYNLRCCSVGKWKDRIIIPVYQYDKLIAWTGRALGTPINAPRYLSTSNAIKTAVLNENAPKGKILFITEGPFDAIKLDYYGYEMMASAVAVFGTSITIDQIMILAKMAKRFKETVILLDKDAVESAFNLADWIPRASLGMLPDRVKDPGEMGKEQIESFIRDNYADVLS